MAVQIADYFGIKNVLKTANKLGLTNDFRKDLTVALGSQETNLLNITSAYATINNDGIPIFPYGIKHIIKDGNIIYKRNISYKEPIFNDVIINNMKFLLFNVVIKGTGKNAKIQYLIDKTDSYNYSRIIDIYKCFQSKIESFFFLRIFESIVNFQTKKLIDIFESLDENMQESVNHFSSIVVLEKLEDYINLFSNVSNKSEKNAKETQINDNEFTYSNNATSIDNDIYIEYLSKCKAKLTEISWLIEDFEHAIKEDYKKSCKEIDSVLDRGIENKEKFNKIIEHINNIYKNAYYKKHNKSSLAYIMDDEDENIKYIEYIN